MLSAAIVVISSEKYYWYPQGFARLTFVELVVFYSLPLAVTLLVIDRYRVDGVRAIGIASAIFSLGVEGIITPVVYEDGPLPVMAVYFLAWHGYFSFVYGWYLVRRWALQGRAVLLGVVSVVHGAGWAFWSTTYWRPESIAEFEAENASGEGIWDPGQWSVSKFSGYVITASLVFVTAHWLLGHVWPEDWAITKRWRRLLYALVGFGLIIVTIAVPWAPIKLGLLGYPIIVLLRRHRERAESSVFEHLAGTVSIVRLAPILLGAPSAIAMYAAMTAYDPSVAFLDGVFATFTIGQLAVGVVIVVSWLRRADHGMASALEEPLPRLAERPHDAKFG